MCETSSMLLSCGHSGITGSSAYLQQQQQPCNGRAPGGGNAARRLSSSGGLDSSMSSPRPGSPASAELFGEGI